jgi:hypothetical protein
MLPPDQKKSCETGFPFWKPQRKNYRCYCIRSQHKYEEYKAVNGDSWSKYSAGHRQDPGGDFHLSFKTAGLAAGDRQDPGGMGGTLPDGARRILLPAI